MTEVCALITALNEDETIGGLVHKLISYGWNVIVVNDGSTDDTGKIARLVGAQVITHDRPHGIAASLMEAWRAGMADCSHRYFVQIDAGGSHSPVYAPWMLTLDADIVIGSRFCEEARYDGNRPRYYMSRLAAAMCNWAKPKAHISDWTSGYRVFTRDALGKLLYENYYRTGHAWQIEVLAHAIRDGMTIVEHPILYTAGRSSASLKTIDEMFSAWLELLFL